MKICKCKILLFFVIFLLLCDDGWGKRRKNRQTTTNRKAKCRKPDPVEHAELREKYEKKNKFNHGDEIQYDCELGYTIEGTSRKRECNNGTWSEVQFTCNVIVCPWIPPPENGRRVDVNNEVGRFTTFECNIGYRLQGNSKVLCRIDGNWYPSEPPVCDPILCPPLPRIKNGDIFQDTSDGLANNYESVTEYSCNRDFYLNGNAQIRRLTRTCQADGTWSGKEPVCDVPKCNEITNFYGGSVEYFGGRSLYSQAFYSCNENFEPKPRNVDFSTCETNLQWRPSPPTCYGKAKVHIPEGGYLRGQRKVILLHEETYKICCKKGFEVESDGNLPNGFQECKTITNNNGTLEPKVQCLEERCDPAKLHNGFAKYEDNSHIGSKFPSGLSVFLFCKDGFGFYDNSGQPINSVPKRMCKKGEIINAPTCIEEKCSLAERSSNQFTSYKDPDRKTKISKNDYIDSRNRIEVYCDEQYELYVNVSKRYITRFIARCDRGMFDKDMFPVCLEKRCSFKASEACFIEDNGGKCLRDDFKIQSGSSVNINCYTGYELFVNEEKVEEQGSLNCNKGIHPPFKCIPKKCSLDEHPSNPFMRYRDYDRMTQLSTDEYIDSGHQIEVYCDNQYELYVNDSNKFMDTSFITGCDRGKFINDKFPVCLEKRCSFRASEACFFGDDTTKCKSHDFKIQSGTSVNIRCHTGFKLFVSGEKVEGETALHCEKGNCPSFMCKPKKCSLAEQPSNQFTHYKDLKKKVEISKDAYIDSGRKIAVFCDNHYELYFNNSNKFMDTRFNARCKKGKFDKDKFPICVEKRCSFSASKACFFEDENKTCVRDYKIKSGRSINIRCDPGYQLFVSGETVEGQGLLNCSKGDTPSFKCIPKSCRAPMVKNMKELTEEVYDHNEEVTFTCKDGFCFSQTDTNKEVFKKSKCEFGNWTVDIPKECKAVACYLKIENGTKYLLSGTNTTIIKPGLQDSGTNINVKCNETFDLFDDEETIINDTNYTPFVKCYLGNWQNIHRCKERCVIPSYDNMEFSRNGKSLTSNNTIKHNESVIVTCKGEEMSSNNKSITCKNGSLKGKEFCNIQTDFISSKTDEVSTTRISIDTTAKSTKRPDAPNDSMDQDKDQSNEDNDNVNTETEIPDAEEANDNHSSENVEGCSLSDDQRFTYTDMNDIEIKPGKKITNGMKLKVRCRFMDMYSYLTYDYESYESDTTNEDSEDTIITCNDNNELSQLSLECPESQKNDECMKIDNGEVTYSNGYFYVSCKEGFSLDSTYPMAERCNCDNGHLISIIGGQPKCEPDPCKVPYEFGSAISISNRHDVSLSGGSVVEVGEIVFFNCSKASDEMYEPFNRRFKCENGSWIEDERDKKWKLGNNGTFPKCRKAKCEPECQNGGVCFKDNHCRCKHLTTGDHCENVICDPECLSNGGKCTGPEKCECTMGKFGNNCQQSGCKLPELENMEKTKSPRKVFAPGETITNFQCDPGYFLSTNNGMTCQDNGLWSAKVECVKGAVYLISTKTGSIRYAGTDARVYITLVGVGGRTRKIYFDGKFENNDVDEIRREEKDVRPIERVQIGHDGSGVGPGWYLDYVSIYVENMEEFYVFRNREKHWVKKENDLTLDKEGYGCIDSFGTELKWYPKWSEIPHFSLRSRGYMSLRACKQACINYEKNYCRSVSYYVSQTGGNCHGFSQTNEQLFDTKDKTWIGSVYLRICKDNV